MIKIIIFGTGRHLQNKLSDISIDTEILAFSDNNSSLWGRLYLGKKVIAPKVIINYDFDIVVIATNKYFGEINQQLLSMGILPEQIYSLDIFLAIDSRGRISLFGAKNTEFSADVLLISTALNYNGGTLACVYAAGDLKRKYKNVCIAAPDADMKLVKEINNQGIVVAIAPALLAPGHEELELAKNAKFVLVNVYQSIAAACKFSRIKPVLWWIHENSELINQINEFYHCNQLVSEFKSIHTVAVSRNVKENLNKVWPDLPVSIMNYGLPDFYASKKINSTSYGTIVFAVIGSIIYRKAQDVFLKAALEYCKICNVSAEFWMIGGGGKTEFFDEVMGIADGNQNIIWKGEMSRGELENIYPQIDVIVCPSRQEGIPIVVNEGLMNAKICIVADTAGDNDFIVDGESGFFFHGEDVNELAEKMKYVAENYENLEDMRNKARQVYLEHYSMDSFESRLNNEIKLTIESWQPNSQNSDFLSKFFER